MTKKSKTFIEKRSITFCLLYYWGKILGINPLSISNEEKYEVSFFSLFYGCVLGAFYCYVLKRALISRLYILFPSETPVTVIADFIRLIWQFLETFTTFLVCAFYQKRVILIIKNFIRIDGIETRLGIPDEFAKSLKLFETFVTINNIVYILAMTLSDIPWTYYDNSSLFTTWLIFNVPTIASFNMLLIFICILIIVKRKFIRLNDYIMFFIIKENCSTYNSFIEKIGMISQLHRELRNLISRIEEHFALILLFMSGNIFTYQTLNVYKLYRYVKELDGSITGNGFIFLGTASHWVLYTIGMFAVTSNVCGSTVDEANSTGNILHSLLSNYKINKNNESAKLNILSLELLQNRVSISVYGFFALDHFFVYSMIATATTYLIIMLQLYTD